MNWQCIYYLDKVAFPTQKLRDKALKYLPKHIEVLERFTGNEKVDRFCVENNKYFIQRTLARQAILDAQIKKDLYWVLIIGTNVEKPY